MANFGVFHELPPGMEMPKLPEGVQMLPLHPAWEEDPPWIMMVALLSVVVTLLPMAIGKLFGPPPPPLVCDLVGTKVPRSGVALVVAHPDDEAMFFWPTLLQLKAAGVPLSVLCLSSGNFGGVGKRREAEMRRSCARLGVVGADLRVLDLEDLQDGFHAWPVDAVAEQVLEFMQTREIGLVLTFDDGGVSRHPNHVSTSAGVRHACEKAGGGFQVLMLETVPLPWKYFGCVNLLLGTSDETAAVATCMNPAACLQALTVHWSQLVWYRVLSTLFSRYSFLNTYQHYKRVQAATVQAEVAKSEAGLSSGLRRRQPDK